MSDAYRSIKQGLEETLGHAKGKDVGARAHDIMAVTGHAAVKRLQNDTREANRKVGAGSALKNLP